MPLALVISRAFGFQSFQFSTHDPCCLARFDFAVRVPEGATKDQFDQMLQNLLRERFKLVFHYQRKEMAIYELTVGAGGPKLKQSSSNTQPQPDDPWWIPPSGNWQHLDKGGFPVFDAGRGGLAGLAGRYHWTAFNVSTGDIAKTLAEQPNVSRPVVDATGLKDRYDVDLKWVVDLDFSLSEDAKARIQEQGATLPDGGSGPTLLRAVQDQLGLRLNSTKGLGEIVVVDHAEKLPTAN